MSRPRHYWYGIVRKMINMYPKLKGKDTPQAISLVEAYEKELSAAGDKAYAIEEILIKRNHQVGVAIKLGYSETTVKRWISDFIFKVGKDMGY